MRIAKIESPHCNAGWRDFSFLKIATGDGLAGWSEYMENFGAEGLSFVLDRLGERLIGMDPRPVEKIIAFPHGLTRQSPYGINQQAIAAIPNFPVMEIDIEDVPWKDDLVTRVPAIENGEFLLPSGIGWGADVNEDAMRAHPPLRPVQWTP